MSTAAPEFFVLRVLPRQERRHRRRLNRRQDVQRTTRFLTWALALPTTLENTYIDGTSEVLYTSCIKYRKLRL